MTGGVNTILTDVTMLGVNNGLAGNRFALTNVVSHGAFGFGLSQALHATGTFTSLGCFTVAVSSGWLNLTVNCDQNYDGFSMSYGVVSGTISRAANTGLYACPQLQFTGSVQNPLAAVSGSGPTRIDLRGVSLTGSTYGINGNNQADITGYQVKITAPTRVQLALTPASNLVAHWPNRVFLFDPVAADDTVKWGYIECHTPGGYPAYVPNPAADNDPTQPPMMANPKDALQYTMECVTGELVQRVRNVIAHEERQKAEAAIQAAINAQIGDVTVS